MKCTGGSALIRFLYFAVLIWSTIVSAQDSKDGNVLDKLQVQPQNSSGSNEETKLNPSEADLIGGDEELGNNEDLHPTEVLEKVSGTVFAEVGSEPLSEIINNDTPIVISRIDSATEALEKQANIASPLTNIDEPTETLNPNITSNTNQVLETPQNQSNINETEVAPNKTEAEDIPSFSEWAQKHLAAAEKKENFSSLNLTTNTTKHAKLRWKNYASVDCGAKVILANQEAQHTWAILVGSRDEYILNPCNSRSIWFIVELCEAIQLKKIDLANYELFSSSPKDFAVYISDRFPTRDWSLLGQFTAKDERNVQNFDINSESFGKYVKVEIKSHYGSEHYCPLSLFRAYGMSVFEALQKDDPGHEQTDDDDDDDDLLDSKQENSGNLLSSATDAVLSMVKKAAQVLGTKVNNSGNTAPMPIIKSCNSPSHYVVCNNCTDTLFGKIYELLSCHQSTIKNLIAINYIKQSLINSNICHIFGFNFQKKSMVTVNSNHIEAFFPAPLLGAMCNFLGISFNKVHYNISHHYANTTTDSVDISDINNDIDKAPSEPAIEEIVATEPQPELNTKSSCSTDTTYAQLIKPSETYGADLNTATLDPIVEPMEMPTVTVEPATVAESAESEAVASDDGVDENVDKFITELNTAEGVASASTLMATNNLQKESVFLRLSNRIKTLERNMSLSSQYLEELHKRYKKQVEDMQRVLEKTLQDVTAKQEERHKQIEEKLESLTRAMENLSKEKTQWKWFFCCLFFVFIFCFLCVGYCFNKWKSPSESPVAKSCEIQRRNSIDVVVPKRNKKKKRRPSDQALKIVVAAGDQQKKRRKKSPMDGDWVADRSQIIEDIPFPLEESDTTTLEPLELEELNQIDAPDYIKTTAASFRLNRSMSMQNGKVLVETKKPESPETSNGSLSSNEQSTPKKMKKGLKKLFKKVF